jgi:hypothetical protein
MRARQELSAVADDFRIKNLENVNQKRDIISAIIGT